MPYCGLVLISFTQIRQGYYTDAKFIIHLYQYQGGLFTYMD